MKLFRGSCLRAAQIADKFRSERPASKAADFSWTFYQTRELNLKCTAYLFETVGFLRLKIYQMLTYWYGIKTQLKLSIRIL